MKLNYGSFLSVMETYYLDVQPYHAYFEIQTTGLSKGIRRQIMLLLSFTPEDRLDRLTELDKAVFSNLRNHKVNLSEELREYASGADPEKVKEHFSDFVLSGISNMGYLSMLAELSNLIVSDASIVPAQKNSFLEGYNACDAAVENNDPNTDELLSSFLSSVFLYAVLQDNCQLEGSIPEPVISLDYLINAKMSRNPYFTGRMEELSLISENFALHTLSEPSSIQVISGPPGAGKSQLALEYAYISVESGCTTIWIDAKDDQGFIDAYSALLTALNIPVDGGENAIIQQVHNWAANHECLFVLDDADYATREGKERIKRFIPKHPTRKILLTTRNPKPYWSYPIISLESLCEDDAVEFLRKRIGRNNLQEKQLLRLANRLGRLPLALEQVGAYLAHFPALSISGYIKALDEQTERLLSNNTALTLGARSVLETLSLTMDSIEDEDVKFLLYTFAYYPDEFDLTDYAFWDFTESNNEAKRLIAKAFKNEVDWLELVDKLTSLSLCRVSLFDDEPFPYNYCEFKMHDLTKEALRILNKDARCIMPAIRHAEDLLKIPDLPDYWPEKTVFALQRQVMPEVIDIYCYVESVEAYCADPDVVAFFAAFQSAIERYYELALKLGGTDAESVEDFLSGLIRRLSESHAECRF